MTAFDCNAHVGAHNVATDTVSAHMSSGREQSRGPRLAVEKSVTTRFVGMQSDTVAHKRPSDRNSSWNRLLFSPSFAFSHCPHISRLKNVTESSPGAQLTEATLCNPLSTMEFCTRCSGTELNLDTTHLNRTTKRLK